jgi:Family of unknown function (DUF5681)
VSEPPYKVGYGRPPAETRWRKGQSGNPRKRRRARPESGIEMIDSRLLRPINVIENGRKRRMTTLEAIVLRLCAKAITANPRALRALLKFEELARQDRTQEVEIQFVDSDYTRGLLEEDSSENSGNG